MKRATAVRHLAEMAAECDTLNERLETVNSRERLTHFWAYGDILDPSTAWGDAQTFVQAAVMVDLPEAEMPWLVRPPFVDWISSLGRWDQRPVHVVWRSSHAPIWNHVVQRPVQLWDVRNGVSHASLEALRDGDAERFRIDPPPDADLRWHLGRQAEISLAAVRRTAAEFEDKRWGRANHLRLADDLWAATNGYLDVLDGLSGLP